MLFFILSFICVLNIDFFWPFFAMFIVCFSFLVRPCASFLGTHRQRFTFSFVVCVVIKNPLLFCQRSSRSPKSGIELNRITMINYKINGMIMLNTKVRFCVKPIDEILCILSKQNVELWKHILAMQSVDTLWILKLCLWCLERVKCEISTERDSK